MIKFFECRSCNLMKVVFFDKIEIKIIFGVLLLNKWNFLLVITFFEFKGLIENGFSQHDILNVFLLSIFVGWSR